MHSIWPSIQNAVPRPKKPGTFTKGDLRINRTKPGPGRLPAAFQEFCQEIACSGAEAARRVMSLPNAEDHPAYLGALKWATEHGYGKPKETVDLKMSGAVKVEFSRESKRRTAG